MLANQRGPQQHQRSLGQESLATVNKDADLTPAPGTTTQAADPPSEMTLHPPSAGATAATEPVRKSVLSPATMGCLFITSRSSMWDVGSGCSEKQPCKFL
jgi:hypothetical protein